MKIDKAELIRLGTPIIKSIPKKLTKEQEIVLYVKKHKKASTFDLMRAVRLSGHAKEILSNIEYKKLIKGRNCECGYNRIYTLP